MVISGLVDLEDFKFLNERHILLPDGSVYPYKVSTVLYPGKKALDMGITIHSTLTL